MKKTLGVLAMVVICVVFFFSLRGRFSQAIEINKEGESYKAKKVIEECKNTLENNYPEDPQNVIEIYNKLYAVVYGDKMSEDYMDLYCDTVALLYSKQILALNPVDTIKENIEKDLKSEDKPAPIIGTKMMGVTTSEKDGTMNENEVLVTCQYYTKNSNFIRDYYLIKEDGKWKIYSWDEKDDINE